MFYEKESVSEGGDISSQNNAIDMTTRFLHYSNSGADADPGFQIRGRGRTQNNRAEWREARKFWGYFV